MRLYAKLDTPYSVPVTKNVAFAPAWLRVFTNVEVYWYGPSSNARARTPEEEHLVMTWPAAGPALLNASKGLGIGLGTGFAKAPSRRERGTVMESKRMTRIGRMHGSLQRPRGILPLVLIAQHSNTFRFIT
jgi:hypothetical protein